MNNLPLKLIAILLLIMMTLFSGCSLNDAADTVAPSVSQTPYAGLGNFTLKDNGDIISPDGTEYVFFGQEGFVYLLGNEKLIGKIIGEDDSEPFGYCGLYTCDQDTDRIMLSRRMPYNEWVMFYRKKSAPSLDFSYSNCIRIEFVFNWEMTEQNMYTANSDHITSGKGISGKDNVAEFFRVIISGKTAEDAGLYDMIKQDDGTLKNCYMLGRVYGFFEGENAVAVPFYITSFDDMAYSIRIEGTDYVLPKVYLEPLGYTK